MGRRSPDTSYKAQSARRVTTIAVEPHSLTQRTTPIIRVPHDATTQPAVCPGIGRIDLGEVESDESEALLTDTLLLMKDHLIGSVPHTWWMPHARP